MTDIYDPRVVRALFDGMAATYGLTNYLSSFGFTERWRRRCVGELRWGGETSVGLDLMSGMGEAWGLIHDRGPVRLSGVDLSSEMVARARERLREHPEWNVVVREEDVLDNELPSDSADFIISTFGLKTFHRRQYPALAGEVARLLRPGGQVAMVEISVPRARWLRAPYMFYLKRAIPLIGRAFAGNSDDYRMLGRYTAQFGDCGDFAAALRQAGLEVEVRLYFSGCATCIVGRSRSEAKVGSAPPLRTLDR